MREEEGETHWRGRVWRDCFGEEGRFDEESLVSCELGRGVAGADVQGDDWGFEIAMGGSACFPP